MDVFVQTVSSKVFHAKAVSRVVDMVDPEGRVAMDEARKSSGIPRPLPLISYRERGGSNGGAKLSPKMLPLGSNNSYIKSV